MVKFVEFEGSSYFRQRLVLSTLSGKPIRITKIRNTLDEIGLKDSEALFLKLLEEVTNGCVIEINATGTEVLYFPGTLHGGEISWNCGTERSISYFLEALLCFAPFFKFTISARLQGITNDNTDVSVDVIKLAWLPVLKRFLPDDTGLDIKIEKRGYRLHGGGEVIFTCPICRTLKPVQFMNQGKIKRVRGVAFVSKVSPQMANRMIDAVKKRLCPLLSDVYVFTDCRKGAAGGNSPGFGITLSAETTSGVILCAEAMSHPAGSGEPAVPEDIGDAVAVSLLDEVYRGGCMDSSAQSLAFLLMVLGQQDVSQFVSGTLSDYSIQFLRHLKQFFSVQFKIDSYVMPDERVESSSTNKIDSEVEDDQEDSEEETFGMGNTKVLLTCIGAGFSNLNKTLL